MDVSGEFDPKRMFNKVEGAEVIETPPRTPFYQWNVKIQIAKLGEKDTPVKLDRAALRGLFGKINAATMHQPYPCIRDPGYSPGHSRLWRKTNTVVHRPNHNGTHSARQARFVEAIFQFIEERGTKEVRDLLRSLTDEEKLSLELGAYFYRAGRVDESSHKDEHPDDYYLRSAMIYEAYAKQLQTKPEIVEWIKKAIRSDDLKRKHPEMREDPKMRLAMEILGLVHDLELLRCFDRDTFVERTIPSIKNRLEYLSGGYSDEVFEKWLQFSRDVISATGSSRKADKENVGSPEQFAKCSENGEYCWDVVSDVPLPKWD